MTLSIPEIGIVVPDIRIMTVETGVDLGSSLTAKGETMNGTIGPVALGNSIKMTGIEVSTNWKQFV